MHDKFLATIEGNNYKVVCARIYGHETPQRCSCGDGWEIGHALFVSNTVVTAKT